MSVVCLCF